MYDLETNPIPSLATFQPVDENSPRSRMTEQEVKNIQTNGHNLQSLREFSTISRHDKIDQVGIATKLLAESAGKFGQSKLRSALINHYQKPSKP